jgi:hypothetical protein
VDAGDRPQAAALPGCDRPPGDQAHALLHADRAPLLTLARPFCQKRIGRRRLVQRQIDPRRANVRPGHKAGGSRGPFGQRAHTEVGELGPVGQRDRLCVTDDRNAKGGQQQVCFGSEVRVDPAWYAGRGVVPGAAWSRRRCLPGMSIGTRLL